MEVKIRTNNEMIDATIEMVDGVMVVSPKEVKFEPKDGDIVYAKTPNENIIIYKEQPNKLGRYVNYIDEQDLYTHMGDFCGFYADIIEIRPATEEEKKKLFDKIDKEGYEWLADERKLVKKRWMPKFYEEYFIPSYTIAYKFSPCTIIYSNDNIDDDYISRGWAFPNEDKCQQFCDKLNQAINSIKP